ncbi:MAG: SDR family oxidoreductase [Betaproteobacteria bacterium]|nr:SDR family oxidoreductase [Betaproteobacteria bacterium]
METFKNKVAVITGGASGLGLAMARRFAREGMKLVLADIEEMPLKKAIAEFVAQGTRATGIKTDVSKAQDIEALALHAYDTYGGAHILCNNSGVAPGGLAWESTVADWEWCLGVNVWGVIHGLRSFVPRMLKQAGPCHIVNTASVAGLLSPPGMAIYCVSKHAVVTLSECLYQDLSKTGPHIGVSVLCPAYVPTGISDSERNRPEGLKNPPRERSADEIAREEQMRHAVQSGRISAEQVADKVFEGVRDNRFYILTHEKIKGAIEVRMKDILEDRRPTDTFKPRS